MMKSIRLTLCVQKLFANKFKSQGVAVVDTQDNSTVDSRRNDRMSIADKLFIASCAVFVGVTILVVISIFV